MKILAVNVGSTSLKYKLYDFAKKKVLAKGRIERIGASSSMSEHWLDSEKIEERIFAKDHSEAIKHTLDLLTEPDYRIMGSLQELGGVGFKAVHAGSLTGPVRISEDVLTKMNDFCDVAPAHNPPYISAIKSFSELAPGVPLVAVFETWFHTSIPEYARTYSIPKDWEQDFGIRRYGFHGASFRYLSEVAPGLINKNNNDLKIIACHLGGSSSVCAIKDGVSIDTSMGFSPQSGLPMGNRCGDVDVFAILHLMDKQKFSTFEMRDYLTHQSGILGISGVSSDIRDLEDASKEGNQRARLALDAFAYQVKKFIGAYHVILNGADLLVFTGGIGEKGVAMRQRICQGLENIGFELDVEKNGACIGQTSIISRDTSPRRILVLPTDEEWIVARETHIVVNAGQHVSSEGFSF